MASTSIPKVSGIAASTNQFQDDASIRTALSEIDSAVRTLRTQASTFGSNLSTVEIRQDFTKELINVPRGRRRRLTLADTNEEGANSAVASDRQQLSTVSSRWRRRPIRTSCSCSKRPAERDINGGAKTPPLFEGPPSPHTGTAVRSGILGSVIRNLSATTDIRWHSR